MGDHDCGRRYSFSLLGVIAVFAIVNAFFYWWRMPPCCDLTYTTGIPFAFLEEGGFAGIRRLLWAGVAADTASIFALAFITNGLATHPRTRRSFVAAKHLLTAALAEESWLPLKQLAVALAIIAVACIVAFLTKR
jgi:hypothetical protein